MNQTLLETNTQNKTHQELIIEKLTDCSIFLQKNNITDNPLIVTMTLTEWIKNLPEKSWQQFKMAGEICQYILENFKNYRSKNQIEDRSLEENKTNELSIDFLVEKKWSLEFNLSEERQEISDYLKKNLSQLRKKTDNIYLLIFTILDNIFLLV